MLSVPLNLSANPSSLNFCHVSRLPLVLTIPSPARREPRTIIKSPLGGRVVVLLRRPPHRPRRLHRRRTSRGVDRRVPPARLLPAIAAAAIPDHVRRRYEAARPLPLPSAPSRSRAHAHAEPSELRHAEDAIGISEARRACGRGGDRIPTETRGYQPRHRPRPGGTLEQASAVSRVRARVFFGKIRLTSDFRRRSSSSRSICSFRIQIIPRS